MPQDRSGLTALAIYRWLVLHLLFALTKAGLRGEGRVNYGLFSKICLTDYLHLNYPEGLLKYSLPDLFLDLKGIVGRELRNLHLKIRLYMNLEFGNPCTGWAI